MINEVIIGLDYSHNNMLILESASFSEFTQFLFTSGYKIGKIQTGFKSLDALKKYKMIILSTPRNINLKRGEIETIEKYVKNGGCLLFISSTGGDFTNKTNLNELTQKFGFEFVSDEIYDSVNYVTLQKRPIITRFKPHVITEQLKKIVISSSCSIQILDFVEDEKDIKIQWILETGLNSWRKRYDGEFWIEEDSPKFPLLVVIEYYKGKVIGLGNLSIFSSLAREYGFSALDNNFLIANIMRFLIGSMDSEGKPITIDLNLDLYYWIENIVKQDKWGKPSDLINVSLKYFKDNYKEIISEIKKIRLEKREKGKAYKKAKAELKDKKVAEEKILDKLPAVVRKKKDLEDIISALEDITGEKYEISINLDKEEKEKHEKEALLEYNDEDIEEFEKTSQKKAIWRGKPTKSFTDWLNK